MVFTTQQGDFLHKIDRVKSNIKAFIRPDKIDTFTEYISKGTFPFSR